jgi:hypothetical protein
VGELQATRQHAGEDTREQRLPITKPLRGGRRVLTIAGEGPVVMRLAGCAAHGAPAGQMVGAAEDPGWTHAGTMARGWERRRGLTTKSGGMWIFTEL